MPEQRSPEAKKRRAKKHDAWVRETRDAIRLTCPKGQKIIYQAAAEAAGKSLNRWILDLMDQEIQRKGDT